MARPYALIVEDDELLARAYEIIFHQEDYHTEIILDGQVAVERLNEVVPDLVLLDINLPNISGDKIIKRIRSDERFKYTRVILATASHQAVVGYTGTLANVVLEKPVKLSHLRQLIARFSEGT